MPFPETIVLVSAEVLARWDEILDEAAELTDEQKTEFAVVVERTGIIENIARVRQALEEPEQAAGAEQETRRFIEDTKVDLEILDQAVKTAKKLGIPIRAAVVGVSERNAVEITVAEEERISAANVQAIVPAIISVVGGVATSLVVALITQSRGG